MISLEDFKKIAEKEIINLSKEEVEQLYRMSTTFADFAYKKWNEKRTNEAKVKTL